MGAGNDVGPPALRLVGLAERRDLPQSSRSTICHVADVDQGEAARHTITDAISAARFAPYLGRACGDPGLALELYRHNVYISGAAYEACALVEVALRNTIDRRLRVWNAGQVSASGTPHDEAWLTDPAPLLSRLVRGDIRKARRRIARLGGNPRPGHDDLLAQLDFGTWRFLLPDGDPGKQYLWANSLVRGFPFLAGRVVRLVHAVDGVYRQRNRVAHLEPLFKGSGTRGQLRSMRFIMRSIDPALEDWLNAVSRVEAVLADAPARGPR